MCTGSGQHTNGAAADGVAAIGAAGDGPGDMNGEVPSMKRLQLQLSDAEWIRPMCLQELGGVLREHHSSRVRMVFGNTATGKPPPPPPPHSSRIRMVLKTLLQVVRPCYPQGQMYWQVKKQCILWCTV